MSPRRLGRPGIPAPAQRATRAALCCQHPRTGRTPALPGALCASQVAMSLAAGQAAEGEWGSEPRPGPAMPGAVPVGEAWDRQPLPTPLHGERGRCAGRRPRRGAAPAGGCCFPGARPVAVPGWPRLPSGGGWQRVGAHVGCPGKALRRGISLAHASRSASVSEPA